MSFKHVIVVGTSAGGIEALRTIAAGLTPSLRAPILVVTHLAPHAPSVLDQLIARAGRLPAETARDGMRLEPARIYVAPPDCHLLVEPGIARVTKGPRENRFRPAIDPLFRSAAQVYGPATIGVILTGNLDDGTAGLWAIKRLGGIAIVQDPAEAIFPDMPRSALAHVEVDHVAELSRIPALLEELTRHDAAPPRLDVEFAPTLEMEVDIAKDGNARDAGVEQFGAPSLFACPDCHGVLLKRDEGGRVRFRCHTGHAYSIESLVSGAAEGIEHALWTAIRTLEEAALLMEHAAQHLEERHRGDGAADCRAQAAEARRHSSVLRGVAAERQPLRVWP
jgi:two-component system, chemotaxis family, protein-glutamate methylesterase/glutaminase